MDVTTADHYITWMLLLQHMDFTTDGHVCNGHVRNKILQLMDFTSSMDVTATDPLQHMDLTANGRDRYITLQHVDFTASGRDHYRMLQHVDFTANRCDRYRTLQHWISLPIDVTATEHYTHGLHH